MARITSTCAREWLSLPKLLRPVVTGKGYRPGYASLSPGGLIAQVVLSARGAFYGDELRPPVSERPRVAGRGSCGDGPKGRTSRLPWLIHTGVCHHGCSACSVNMSGG